MPARNQPPGHARGFTLLEVMIAGGLLAVLTAAAMGAYLAQLSLVHQQESTTTVTDETRSAIRTLAADLRPAAPGIAGNASGQCPKGTVQLVQPTLPSGDGIAQGIVCLPPAFRSSAPLFFAGAQAGIAIPSNLSLCPNATSMSYGYQLQAGSAIEPTSSTFFCPDDLVVLAADDSDPYFLQGGSTTPPGLVVGGSVPTDGYGFDSQAPQNWGLFLLTGVGSTIVSAPMIAPLPAAVAPIPLAGGACSGGSCYQTGVIPLDNGSYNLVKPTLPGGSGVAGSHGMTVGALGVGSPVLPARFTQYAIQPIGADPANPNTPPFVTANLVRNVVVPLAAAAGAALPGYPFYVVSSTILIQDVVDMQVEFGIQNPQGKMVYVESGGEQQSPWNPGLLVAPGTQPALVNASNVYDACGNATQPTCQSPPCYFPGVCFPNDGDIQTLQSLRSVRIYLTVRHGSIANSRQASAKNSGAGIGAPFALQPAVQDSVTGNAETVSWGWTNSGTWLPPQTADGAEWREVSTEIFMRNLGS